MRREFIRLVLEEVGADYVDVARQSGAQAMLDLLADPGNTKLPLAAPILRDGDLALGQTSLILSYLGEKHEMISHEKNF